ncbi:TlyA family RNA methyltransferase [Chengkuizengella axinellae]|uniref:TlyA family RNA methyltransferase n=1 Tax=Chengkuizengella axinellae TaxID=3064388 RepID=A0ABT9IW65_9BACL|nr:TlyA family RNA methyltransferase [Chengkuizengella sp. 2205SS18-9]MDP5273611.1 TlyA family RNA methyltransferase [Chengkuizengella sp. 2205SS18-9]
MHTDKERIDILLIELGHFESREKAKAAIMAGLVFANDERIEKAGTKIPRDAQIRVKGNVHPYVSRGGLKLEKAIQAFNLQLKDSVVLDIGASTGGFTDCALQNGAAYVYAIDVGYNQLDWSLRNSPKVKVMERTNFRYVQKKDLVGPVPTFASIDVSFISLRLILPALKEILDQGGTITALVKPQFEAGRDKVGKSGVIKDPETHREVLHTVLEMADQLGLYLTGLTYSPIKGGEGNIEFLAYWSIHPSSESNIPSDLFSKKIDEVVYDAQSLQNHK